MAADRIEASDAAEGGGWSRLWSWMAGLPDRMRLTGAEPSVEAAVPSFLRAKVSLKIELRDNNDFVGQLRGFLRDRQGELTEQVNRIVRDLVERARKRWNDGEWKGLVVIVDSLDHARAADSRKFQEVRHELTELFSSDFSKLSLRDCRMVFTLPPYVPGTGSPVPVRRVTNVRVTDRARKTDGDGVAALTEVLRRRVPGGDLYRIFPDRAAIERVVAASGGNLRMLLGLAMELTIQAESLPVDDATITTTIQQMRNSLPTLADDERAMLAQVARTKELPLATQSAWDVVSGLLDLRFVLGYQNGELWYDVHPLLRDEIDRGR